LDIDNSKKDFIFFEMRRNPYDDLSSEASDIDHERDLRAKMESRKRLNRQYTTKYCTAVGIKNNIPKVYQDYDTCPDELWIPYEAKVRAFLFDFHREANEYKMKHGKLPTYYQSSTDPQDQQPSEVLPPFLEPLTSSTPISWGGYNRKCYMTPPRINSDKHPDGWNVTPMSLDAESSSSSSSVVPNSTSATISSIELSSSSSLESKSSFLTAPLTAPPGVDPWEWAAIPRHPPARQLHAVVTARRNKKTGKMDYYDQPRPLLKSTSKSYLQSKPLCFSDYHYPLQKKTFSSSSSFSRTCGASYRTSFEDPKQRSFSQQHGPQERSPVSSSSHWSTNQSSSSDHNGIQQSFSQQHGPQERSPVLSPPQCLASQGTFIESPEKEQSSTSTPTATSRMESEPATISSSSSSSSMAAPVIHNHYNYYIVDKNMLSQLQAQNLMPGVLIGAPLIGRQKSQGEILRKRRYNKRQRLKKLEKAQQEAREKKEKEKESKDEEE
jgi:hypothetical protein